jgi:hypothetical protein
MHLKNFIFVLAGFLILQSSSCEKEEISDCFTVELITNICGQYVFQIKDAEHQHLGEKGWVGADNKTLDHVFYTELSCDDMKKQLKNGDKIKVVTTAQPKEQNCAVCLALLTNRPKKEISIKISEDCN